MANLKSNVLGRAQVNNKVSLNAFDLSHRNVFSSSAGEILPVSVIEMLPNEKATVKPNWFTRAQALQSDSFGRLIENTQTFFVPFSSLWRFAPQSMLSTIGVNLNGETDSRICVDPGVSAARGEKLPLVYLSDLFAYCAFYEAFAYNLCRLAKTQGIVQWHATLTDNFLGRDNFLRSISSARLFSYLGYGSFKEVLDPSLRDVSKQVTIDLGDGVHYKVQPLTQNAMQVLNDTVANLLNDDKEVSVMRLLAYHKVYNDFYRNDVWSGYVARACNIDYVLPSHPYIFDAKYKLVPLANYLKSAVTKFNNAADVNALFATYNDFINNSPMRSLLWRNEQANLFDLESCNLEIDYVNGVLPSPQYGDASRVLTTTAARPTATAAVQVNAGSSYPVADPNKFVTGTLFDDKRIGFSIKDLRVASSLQKFREIASSHDNDYTSQLLAHFGVAPQDDIYRSYFVGGNSNVMQVDTQVNTNLDGANAIRGGIANAQGGYSCTYKSNTYGMLITLYRIYPIIDYGNDGMCEQVSTVRIDSLPIPEMDSNGFVSQRRFRVCDYMTLNPTDTTDYRVNEDVYGYSVPYLDYKVAKDVTNGNICYTDNKKVVGRLATGIFLSGDVDNSPLADMEKFFICKPQNCDAIFANNAHVTLADDQFYTNLNVGVSIVRPLSVHGLPFAN